MTIETQDRRSAMRSAPWPQTVPPRRGLSDGMAQSHDPLAKCLSSADDRVRLNEWLPPQAGVIPRIRIGRRWINVLWALPLLFVLLVGAVAVAHSLRELATVQEFLVRYPGIPASALPVTAGFPGWLRLLHFLNLFFMLFIIRAGVQILADHPRLYWKRDCTPGGGRHERSRAAFDCRRCTYRRLGLARWPDGACLWRRRRRPQIADASDLERLRRQRACGRCGATRAAVHRRTKDWR